MCFDLKDNFLLVLAYSQFIFISDKVGRSQPYSQKPINLEVASKRTIAGESAKHVLQSAYIIKQSIKSVSM
jgi:hypothetical protein